MNNQPEQNKQDLDITPEQYVQLSALLDAAHTIREEHAQDVVDCFKTVELI